jgi:hypothetical protein
MRFPTNALSLLVILALPAGSGFSQGTPAAAAPAVDAAPAVKRPTKGMHRYMVVRTFPAGALAGLDAAAKKSVNACNSTHEVKWVYSYANADKTKTFCIYEAPNEKAIQDAAKDNKIPVDSIVEIPVVLNPK